MIDKCYIVSSNNLINRLDPLKLLIRKFTSPFQKKNYSTHFDRCYSRVKEKRFCEAFFSLHRKLNKIDTITLTYLLDRLMKTFLSNSCQMFV